MAAQATRPRLTRSSARRRVRTPALLAVAALTLSACGAASGGGQAAADTPFTIGLIAPETGPTASTGQSLIQAFELAVEHVNEQGGVLGRDVEFVMVDDRGDAAASTQAAQRLIQQEEVDYLFGTITDDTAIAVAEVAQAASVPFSTAIIADVEQCGPHFWPFGGTPAQILPPLVPEMIERHGSAIALVGSDYVFPRNYMALAKQSIEAAGGEVVFEGYSPLGTADWQPVINNIGGAQPDWVLSAVVGGDAVAFMQQAGQFGLLDEVAVTGVSIDPDYYPALADSVEGSIRTGYYSDQLESEQNETFVAAYREAYGVTGPIAEVAASTYDGVMFIAEAVEAAGSTDPDAIAEQMVSITREGLTGTGSFNPDNHLFSKDVYLMEIRADGAYTPIEDFGTVVDERPRQCE